MNLSGKTGVVGLVLPILLERIVNHKRLGHGRAVILADPAESGAEFKIQWSLRLIFIRNGRLRISRHQKSGNAVVQLAQLCGQDLLLRPVIYNLALQHLQMLDSLVVKPALALVSRRTDDKKTGG